MRVAREPDPHAEPARSANQRFKAGWSRSVAWSTAAAVALHVAVFTLTAWETFRPTPDFGSFDGQALRLLPVPEGTSGLGGIPALATPIIDEIIDDPAAEPAAAEGPGVSGDLGDLWDALAERLRAREPLVPTLAEPGPTDARELANAKEMSDDGDPALGGGALLSDLSVLPETDSLDMDRLSALRPELALVMPSSWVLISNPVEVETFLRGAYTGGRLDPNVEGSVNVTLWIDEMGTVQWAEISESSGRRDLDEFVLALFNEVAVFRPAREQGVRVSRSVSFALNFPW